MVAVDIFDDAIANLACAQVYNQGSTAPEREVGADTVLAHLAARDATGVFRLSDRLGFGRLEGRDDVAWSALVGGRFMARSRNRADRLDVPVTEFRRDPRRPA